MGSTAESPASKVEMSYRKLATAAAALNNSSDELGKVVTELDAALKSLNLGISSWVNFRAWEQHPDWSCDQLGYSKVGGKWGVAIRTVSGDYLSPGDDKVDAEWAFNDAPRAMRIAAIDHIPELLEKLVKEVEATTNRVNERLKHSQAIAEAISAVANPAESLRQDAAPPGISADARLSAIKAALFAESKFVGSCLNPLTGWRFKKGQVHFSFSKEGSWAADLLQTRGHQEKLRAACEKVLGQPVKVCVTLDPESDRPLPTHAPAVVKPKTPKGAK